jgi:tetratricopeptide (TPR) repeat protein
MIRRSLVMLTAALSFGQVSFGVAIAAMPVSAAAQGQRVNTKALQAAAANAARAATKKALQDLDTQYELVKVRLDTASALASNLTQLVIVVASLLGVYSFLVTIWSFFGLKNVKDEAEKELSAFRTSIRESHPEIEQLQLTIRQMLDRMRLLLSPGVQWEKDGYSEIPDRLKQQILLAEMNLAGVAAFGLGRLDQYKPLLADVNRVLGRFYTSRYFAGNKWDDLSDWYRSGIYLSVAEELSVSAPVLSDIGTQLMAIDAMTYGTISAAAAGPKESFLADLRSQAEQKFRKSLELNSDDVSALYGLGWISMARQDFVGAHAYYERIPKIQSLPPDVRAKFVSNAYYNAACCVWLDPNGVDKGRRTLDELQASLRVAREYGRGGIWSQEFGADEDLEGFRAQHRADADQLLA